MRGLFRNSVSDNGILTQVGGTFIAQGAQQLPRACEAEQHEAQRVVSIEVPHLGLVRLTYQLNTYRHGRSRHWHWVAVRAEPA